MSQQAPLPGDVIAGRYEVEAYQRDGRMGNVWVARRLADSARVSVKLLDPALFDNVEALKRFQRETRVTKRIHSPYCLAVLDSGKNVDGSPFLVLEFADGERLSDALKSRTRLSVISAARVAAQVALALEAAHAVQIIHRDLSPENVLLVAGQQDVVKVLDFGLARLEDGANDEDTSLTQAGMRVGDPSYMAPEYIEESELDQRADLYSLGCLLYHTLVGAPPFVGRPYHVLDQHINTLPTVPSQKVPEIPAWMDEVVLALLAKKPSDRPSTAREVVEALQAGTGELYGQTEVPEGPQGLATEDASPQKRQVTRQDPILTRFIEDRIGNVFRKGTTAPDPRQCLIVERVAAKSIAAQVGVPVGAWLQVTNVSTRHSMMDPRIYQQVHSKRTYKFYLPHSQETLTLETSGMHLGIECARHVEHIKSQFDPGDPDADALYEVWRQSDWATLEQLSYRTLTGASRGLTSGLIARFMGTAQLKVRNHPALLFYGAALVETGRGQEGWEFIHEFRTHYATHWPDVYRALSLAYLGLQRVGVGQVAHGLSLLQESWTTWPIPRISEAISRVSGHPHDPRLWFGLQFPQYDLHADDGRRSVNLHATLSRMDPSQVALVVMLGGFRGNALYDDFMRRLLNFGAYFNDFIGAVHVVTTRKDRHGERPEHYVGEDMVLQAGLHVELLEDYRAFVQRAVKPPNIPTVYALNNEGLVVHEGPCEGADLWDALALVGQIRLKRLERGR